MHFREYWQATGINLLFTFAIFLYYPILAPYVKNLGLDEFQIGLIFSILPLAMIFSAPIMGRLADDVGRVKVIILGLLLEISALVLYLIGTYWWVIAVARLLDAVAIAGVSLVALAKVEDALSDRERGTYAGWSFSLTHVGAVVAPVVGGILADKLFLKSPFILSAFMLLVLTFILVFRTGKGKKFDRKDLNLFDELKTFLSVRSLKGMAILGMVMHASTPAIQVFLPLYLIEKLGLSYTSVGVAFFFLGIPHVLQFYFGHLNNKYGRVHMTLLGCFITAISLFLLSITNSFKAVLVMLFFLGLGSAIWNVSAWTLMSDIGEKIKKEGEIIGSYMSIAKTGAFISFLLSGLIVQLYGTETLFVLNALVITVGILLSSVFFDIEHDLPKPL